MNEQSVWKVAFTCAFTCIVACNNDKPSGALPVDAPAGTTGFPAWAGTLGSGVDVGSAGTGNSGAAGTPAATSAGPGAQPTAAGTGAAGGGAVAFPVASDKILPCDVNKALVANCGNCHGTMLLGGAPMPLLSWDDFQKPAKTAPAMKVADLVKARINDKARPMPPGGGMSPGDLASINNWLNGGMIAGGEADRMCDAKAPPPDDGLSFGPLTPLPGETCYEFPVNNGQTIEDKTPYVVPPGEHYVQFYYSAPWPTGTIGTRYGTKFDNQRAVHHWLLFGTDEWDLPGTHRVAPLPTLLGVNAQLLAGWAVGGANTVMPEDVGFELPPNGQTLNIQWHYYNTDTADTKDASTVQVCTMPPSSRKNVASITWVGTEDLNGNVWFGGQGMPAHQESTFQGTCAPSRAGMNATDPIKIIGFWPHMHQLGTRMQSFINRKNGMKELVFDKPFDFNYQINYIDSHDLFPGDTLTAVCHFNNTTDRGVPFGESSDTEMCYNFVMSYPAHALENGVLSLIGATNTCW